MSGWPGPGLRAVTRWILGLASPRDEAEQAMDDLLTLGRRERNRTGRLRASLWLLRHAAAYPLLELSGRGGTGGSRAGGGRAERWIRDVRFAVRRLRRSPVATGVIVLTLGVGVGAGTSVFAVLQMLLFGPLPFDDPDTLVRVRESMSIDGTSAPREVSVSPRRYTLLREGAPVFSDVAAVRYRTFTLAGDGEAERVIGLRATGNYFDVLGVRPVAGRTFGEADDVPGAPAPVAVIAHSLWSRRFGGDPSVVGSTMMVNGSAHTVLGVMPPGFRYPYAGEVWLPMGIDPARADWEDRGLNVTARLAAGVDPAAVTPALDALSARLTEAGPAADANTRFVYRSIEEEVLEDVPAKVLGLLGAAVFVLLIGAANIASMVLARLHGEQTELDLRVVLGAGRGDLARRLVAELGVLAGLGLLVGTIFSGNTVGWLTALSPVSDLGPYFQEVAVGLPVVAFGGLLAAAAMLVASVPTLLRLSRGRFGASVRNSGIGERRGRLGFTALEGLVAGEVALAVILLAGAGLTVQTLRGQWNGDLGVDAEGLYTFGVSPTPGGYADPVERRLYVAEVLDAVRAIPGVERAGLTNLNPMRSQGWGAAVWPEGREVSGEIDYMTVNHRGVTPGYFAAAGTELLHGRVFGAEDSEDAAPTAVVSRRAAIAMWGESDVVGRTLRQGRASGDGPLVTVVGVVEDVAEYDFLDETWYRPYAQDPRDYNTEVLEVFVRSDAPTELIVPAVRRAIQAVDASVPVFSVEPMTDLLRVERRIEAFAAFLLLAFSGIGVLLAAVGIYGVLSYSTGTRTAELGLRIALGAGQADVVRDVTGRAARSCAVGLVVGLVGAAFLARFLEAFVAGVPAFRFDAFGGAAVATLLLAGVAALGPARRALRIAPRDALTGG